MESFSLQIVTPDGCEYDGQAEKIVCRTIRGDVAVLARHCDYCTAVGMQNNAVQVLGIAAVQPQQRGGLVIHRNAVRGEDAAGWLRRGGQRGKSRAEIAEIQIQIAACDIQRFGGHDSGQAHKP